MEDQHYDTGLRQFLEGYRPPPPAPKPGHVSWSKRRQVEDPRTRTDAKDLAGMYDLSTGSEHYLHWMLAETGLTNTQVATEMNLHQYKDSAGRKWCPASVMVARRRLSGLSVMVPPVVPVQVESVPEPVAEPPAIEVTPNPMEALLDKVLPIYGPEVRPKRVRVKKVIDPFGWMKGEKMAYNRTGTKGVSYNTGE